MTDLSNLTPLSIASGDQNRLSLLLKVDLNNTGFGRWGDEDWIGGDYELAGISDDSTDNSAFSLSSGKVLHPEGFVYQRLGADFFYTTRISRPFDTFPKTSFGGLTIPNAPTNSLPGIYDRRWEGGTFELMIGGLLNVGQHNEYRMAASEYQKLIGGVFKAYSATETHISPTLSSEDKLDIDFPKNRYKGTGGLNGDSSAKGKVIPVMIGTPKNITPQDIGGSMHQWHDPSVDTIAGTPSGTIVVRDDGTVLTNLGSSSDLAASNPASGQYYVDFSSRAIKVGGEPKNITIDTFGLSDYAVDGNTSGTYGRLASSVKALIEDLTDAQVYMNANVGSETLPDGAGTTEFYGEAIGYYIDRKSTLREVVHDLLSNCGYVLRERLDGNFEIMKRQALSAENVAGLIPTRNVVQGSEDRPSLATEYFRYAVTYDRNWTVQDKSNLPFAVSREYSQTGLVAESTNVDTVDTGVTLETREIISPFINEADAQALADTIAKDGRYAHNFTFTVKNKQWLYFAGDLIQAGVRTLRSGLIMEILSTRESFLKKETTFEVIAYA